MNAMQAEMKEIADRARGVFAELHCSQQQIADILELSRGSVNERLNYRVAFTAPEILVLSRRLDVPISRFYGEDLGGRARRRGRAA